MKKVNLLAVLFTSSLLFHIFSCQSNEKTDGQTVDKILSPTAPAPPSVEEFLYTLVIERSKFAPLSNGKVLVLSYYFDTNSHLTLKGQQVNGSSGNFSGPVLNFETSAISQIKFTTGARLSNVLVPKNTVRAIKELDTSYEYLYFIPEYDNSEIRYLIYPSETLILSDSVLIKAWPPPTLYANPSPPKNYNDGE
jgi:hypothetical protein